MIWFAIPLILYIDSHPTEVVPQQLEYDEETVGWSPSHHEWSLCSQVLDDLHSIIYIVYLKDITKYFWILIFIVSVVFIIFKIVVYSMLS
jgi:hypothetical protein